MILRFFMAALLLLAAEALRAEPDAFEMQSLGSEGRTVYLIPGLASPGSVWNDLAEALVSAGYRVRILTLAGFAGVPPLDGQQFLPVVREQLAAELSAHEGLRPVLVGHSLGAFLSLWLGATEPEAVGGIVAMDGVPYLAALSNDNASPMQQQEQAAQMAQFMASLTPEQYAAQNRMALAGMISSAEDVEQIARESSRSDPASVGRAVAEMLTTDIRPLMPEIQAPVVLIQAADAAARKGMHAAYARQVAAIPDHRHVVADQGRHFVQIDDPEFVRREVLRLLEVVEND